MLYSIDFGLAHTFANEKLITDAFNAMSLRRIYKNQNELISAIKHTITPPPSFDSNKKYKIPKFTDKTTLLTTRKFPREIYESVYSPLGRGLNCKTCICRKKKIVTAIFNRNKKKNYYSNLKYVSVFFNL